MAALGLLGPLELRRPDGDLVRIGSGRQRRLLSALAMRPNSAVDADLLVELIWGAELPADPAGALQTAVARLRRLLPPGVRIATADRSYRLVIDPDEVDVARFCHAVDAAGRDGADDLAAALTLWRGRPYLELDHPVVAPEVARLIELRAGAVEQRGKVLLDDGRPGEAVAVLEALVADEPLRERSVGLLARALVAAGRQADALGVLARLRRALAEQLGVDPSPELRRLEQRVLRQEIGPTSRGARGVRPPLQVSSFIGRDGEVSRVAELLGRCRVVTLTGTGGVGKTRLAAHVVHAVADRYDDGVVSVELATLREPTDVTGAVAAALRLTDSAAETLSERIVAVLAVRRALVVLDNCEHLADAVAELVEAITTGTTGVDVLATSREPLRADGEHLLPIRPLDASDAVALLADRILAADPEAEVTDTAMLAGVAARLDGLPLALELAAARVPAMGLAALLAALDEPLDVLGRGRRTAAQRHRSLRAVVEWSAALLSDTERELFVRLAVFGGAVEADAVVAVCSDPDLPAAVIVQALADLVDRSLVVTQPRRGDLPRYGMLETLRAFGRGRLATRPDAAALRGRHADWALRLADEVARGRWGPSEPEFVARFDAYLPELRRAHGWLAAAGRIEDLLRLSLVLADLADQRQRVDLARLVDETLAVTGDAVHPLAARLLGRAAHPAWQRGDLDTARRRCEQAFRLAAALDDPAAARDAHGAMGNIELFRGYPDAAVRHSRRAAELAGAAGDRPGRLIALVDLTLNETYAGRHGAAAEHEPEIAALATELGAPTALGWAAYAAGERWAERDPQRAVPLLQRALVHAESADVSFLAGVIRHTLLTTAARGAHPAVALPRFAPLIDHWHRCGSWTQLWIALRCLVDTLSHADRHAVVARLLGAHDVSARAAPPFGADADRLRAATAAARAALGEGYDAVFAEGRQLGDEGAVACALRACERPC